jgi:hypothetical protein
VVLDSSVHTLKQARETDNDRLAALQAVKGALTLGQGAQSVMLDQATGNQKGNDNTVGISLSTAASRQNPPRPARRPPQRQQPHRRE